jgi:cytochrome c oxidase cbb3-type subunit I/II
VRLRITSVRRVGGLVGLMLLAGWILWRQWPAGVQSTDISIATESPAKSTPWDPNLDRDRVLQGRYLFERNCAVCHGRWGDGRGEMAEGMRPKPRNLASGIFKFRSTPGGFLPTDGDLERTLRRGIANSSMPTFAHLQTREVQSLVAYLKTLSPRWQQRENYGKPIEPLPEPDWLSRDAESKPHRAAGEQLFIANCAPCHGLRADGKSDLAATLEDRWGELCPPSNLRTDALKCGPELADLFRILATGLDGTPMPSFREGLSDAERWDLVAYLGSLRR